ncbi:hypothetical protein CDIK_0456 [Cucumispora dikerogammari]|nr:hypothetical protein CDIK_0456 [Cucumispora dikerogammari]
MFTQITSILTNILCEADVYSTILKQPTIIDVKRKPNMFFNGFVVNYMYYKIVKTDITFQISSDTTKYKICEKNVAQNVKILFVDTHVGEDNNSVFFQGSNFNEINSNNLMNLEIKCRQIKKSNRFVVSLKNKNKNLENPLIKYLKINQNKGFKLQLSFLNPSFKNIQKNFIKVIKALELRMCCLKEKLEQGIGKLVVAVDAVCHNYLILEKSNTYIAHRKLSSVIKNEIGSIQSLNGYSKDIKSKAISYLSTLENISRMSFIAIAPKKDFVAECKVAKKLGCELFDKTLVFLIEEVESVMSSLNVPFLHKRKILKIFRQETNDYSLVDFYFLTDIIEKIKLKAAKSSDIEILETRVFKLNRKIGLLKEVFEVQKKKKTVTICGQILLPNPSLTQQ